MNRAVLRLLATGATRAARRSYDMSHATYPEEQTLTAAPARIPRALALYCGSRPARPRETRRPATDEFPHDRGCAALSALGFAAATFAPCSTGCAAGRSARPAGASDEDPFRATLKAHQNGRAVAAAQVQEHARRSHILFRGSVLQGLISRDHRCQRGASGAELAPTLPRLHGPCARAGPSGTGPRRAARGWPLPLVRRGGRRGRRRPRSRGRRPLSGCDGSYMS